MSACILSFRVLLEWRGTIVEGLCLNLGKFYTMDTFTGATIGYYESISRSGLWFVTSSLTDILNWAPRKFLLRQMPRTIA